MGGIRKKVELMDNFDFNEWAELARTAPDEFEQRRRDVVESHISNSNHIHYLRGLQCNIDMERIRARTPLKSCLRLSTLMWDALIKLDGLLNTNVEEYSESTRASSHSERSAKIIHISTECKVRK
jgi:hypothetical protein